MHYNQSIELKIISSYDEYQKLHSAWNKLLEQSSNDKVFMTHEWFASWWQAFGEGKNLFIVQAKNKDEIIGFVPLMMHKSAFRGMPVKSIEFIENDDSPGCGFIIKKGYEQVIKSIISFLIRDVRNWDVLFFKNMPYDEKIQDIIASTVDQAKRKYIINNGLSSPFLKLESNWDVYFKSISTKSRKTIRNVSNRMKKLGNIKVREFNNMENIEDIISITKKGWKYTEGESFINKKDRERFFKLLSENAQKNGWLSLWCAYNNNEPIAYEYHLKYNKHVTSLLSEYNINYRNYSPGAYLDFEIVKSLFNKGICEYDMCGSEDEYKKKWTNDIRQYRNLIVFNNSIYSRLLYLTETKLIKMIKKIRERLMKN